MNIETLSRTLQIWVRRLRLQRAVLWAVRGFAFGLGFALLVGGLALYQKEILRNEFLLLATVSSAVFTTLLSLTAYLWRIRPLDAARFFDRQFGLGERVSTALELSASARASEMARKQLEDAVKHARKVKPAWALPLRFKKRDGALMLVFLAGIFAVWFRGEQLFAAAQQQRAVETAIAQQQEKIEEIIKAIENHPALTDAQKEALTEPLRQAQRDLQETQALEGAVSVLTTTGEKMQALNQTQGGQTMQSLQAAGSSLAAQEGSPLQQLGQDLANGDFAKAASDLFNMDLSQMSPQELTEAAQQLDALANQLEATNPQMAQQLRAAADQIRAGDLQSAQQALNQAAQQMAQVAEQAAAAQAASQAAGQLSQGAQQLLAAGGGQNAQAQGQQGNGAHGQNPQGGAGGGSGSGNAPDANQTGAEAGSSPIEQDNGPGDGGESTYEQIYAPPLLGGEGGDTLGVPTSGNEGEVIGESPTTATEGASLVPYTEVYGQYDQFNNQAIENGEVPAQFMDVIRNYFDSIQP